MKKRSLKKVALTLAAALAASAVLTACSSKTVHTTDFREYSLTFIFYLIIVHAIEKMVMRIGVPPENRP